ncbi:MAG: UDP-glucose/GDP-mannose dehydrogenase family protein [Candidatus Nezhaarchaeales archaeon]
MSVFGMGYVGLCTAVCFASRGFKVIGVDVEHEKVETINRGIPIIHEEGLPTLLAESLRKGLFNCTLDFKEAIRATSTSFITVGTPGKPNGSTDLSQIEDVSRKIGLALRDKSDYHLVVVKSTVPPGTSEHLVKRVIEEEAGKRCGEGFGLCVNPEFLREGSAVYDTFQPDRIIIGEYDEKSGSLLEDFYRAFYAKAPPILRTTMVNAELIKYASNAFLAMKISFINTMANICERIPNADVTVVAKGIGLDKRIGPSFLNAGLGYGGSCLPKDVKALIRFAEQLNYEPELIKAVEAVNSKQALKAVELAKEALHGLKGKRIAILGLSFKPGTNDMREAVSIKVVKELLKEEANVVVYDPVAIPNAKRILPEEVEYAASTFECIKGADCCIIVTEWDEFKRLKPEDYLKLMRRPIVVDGRRIYDPREYLGKVNYLAIGLGPVQTGLNRPF